ncbi:MULTISPECIES: hypothetical protein [unclassified Micromonospora]|uniref:hypothetical protein n=2 Tax=unclassified Micromonospora TaxID=2617518 RepID=UPI003A861171
MMRTSTVTFREGLPLMDSTPAGIESEMLDLSTVDVATLRGVDDSDMTAAMVRVRQRIADAEGSISGYSGSFAGRATGADPLAEDRIG